MSHDNHGEIVCQEECYQETSQQEVVVHIPSPRLSIKSEDCKETHILTILTLVTFSPWVFHTMYVAKSNFFLSRTVEDLSSGVISAQEEPLALQGFCFVCSSIYVSLGHRPCLTIAFFGSMEEFFSSLLTPYVLQTGHWLGHQWHPQGLLKPENRRLFTLTGHLEKSNISLGLT